MSTTTVFGFPLLPDQAASPEVILNEMIWQQEALARGVEEIGLNAPYTGSSLYEGVSAIVGASPTGAFTGKANCLAYYSPNGWKFVPGKDSAGTELTMGTAQTGMRIFNKADSLPYVWDGDSWEVMTDGSGV